MPHGVITRAVAEEFHGCLCRLLKLLFCYCCDSDSSGAYACQTHAYDISHWRAHTLHPQDTRIRRREHSGVRFKGVGCGAVVGAFKPTAQSSELPQLRAPSCPIRGCQLNSHCVYLSPACVYWLQLNLYFILFYFQIYASCQLTPRVMRLWLYWACELHNARQLGEFSFLFPFPLPLLIPIPFPHSILWLFHYHMGVSCGVFMRR